MRAAAGGGTAARPRSRCGSGVLTGAAGAGDYLGRFLSSRPRSASTSLTTASQSPGVG